MHNKWSRCNTIAGAVMAWHAAGARAMWPAKNPMQCALLELVRRSSQSAQVRSTITAGDDAVCNAGSDAATTVGVGRRNKTAGPEAGAGAAQQDVGLAEW